MTDLATLAKYPFLEETKKYIKENGPSINELLTDIIYERARTLGLERLESTLQKRTITQPTMVSDSDYFMEILSYPIARMIAVCVGDTYIKRRYALGEAYAVYQHLLNEPLQSLLHIASELRLTVALDEDTDKVKLYFKDYLRFAPTHYKEWKMVNRDVVKGYVLLTPRECARLIRETLWRRLNQELDGRRCEPLVQEVFAADIERFKNIALLHHKKAEMIPVGKLSGEHLPPCMKDLLAAMQSGENVPHMGRFALVAFLSSLNLRSEEILKLFSTAPDFEEEKTRYQVDHITGESSTTAYKSPGCEKMRTFGICPTQKMDELCKKIKHPLSYYQYRWKQGKQKS
ncbi:MAG: DNA primase large subunit PriL [Candidatus Thermoplasmatota archaeon]